MGEMVVITMGQRPAQPGRTGPLVSSLEMGVAGPPQDTDAPPRGAAIAVSVGAILSDFGGVARVDPEALDCSLAAVQTNDRVPRGESFP